MPGVAASTQIQFGGGETLEILANNDLGEPVYGTPALVESAIYIRSSEHLWAFGGRLDRPKCVTGPSPN